MEVRKMQLRSLKRAYKKERRRRVTAWKTLSILCLILSLLFVPVCMAASLFDNAVAAVAGGTFWELQKEDPNAMYFKSDFAFDRDLIYREVQAEGAVLLMNNGALPLAAGSRVSTLSSNSVDPICNGDGENMKTALEVSGFTVNPLLWDFYCNGAGADYRRDDDMWFSGLFGDRKIIAEVPMNAYTEAARESVAQYGDAVIITVSRGVSAVEGDHLRLDQNEKDMMAFAASMKSEGKVKKIVVLLNTSNPLQLDFLKEDLYGVDACLWIGSVGRGGMQVVTDVLAGKINPSGSLTDTYCYDNGSSPAVQICEGTGIESGTVFREGIYVGYKYYETRYEDYVMDSGNPGKFVYADNVAFPFGFGLSYTSYDYSDLQVNYEKETDRFAVAVTVTNTGSLAGKETVQVYAQSPYTQYNKENGVEKASAVLCGFSKTQLLEPGKSETVTVYVDRRELASYDAHGAGAYILDAGNYYLTVAADAHNAVNNILAAKGYTVENTEGRMDYDGNGSMTYLYAQKELDAQTYAKSLNGTTVKNYLVGDGLQKVNSLSRSDWEGTWPKEDLTVTLPSLQYDPQNYETVDMPVLGAKNGRKLFEMIGLAYDDPLWDQLLDQLTFGDMVSLIGDAYYFRMPVQSVQAPGVRAESVMELDEGFPSGDVLAATFNTQLIYEVGKVVGSSALAAETACLYGPDCNVRRTPCDRGIGDSFLSGEIAAAQIRAIREKGVDAVVRCFAGNDSVQGVWLNEQAAREIYLKAFQKPLEECNTTGVMIESICWIDSCAPMITGVLQQEWGNRGVYIADIGKGTRVDAVNGILTGVSAYHGALWHARQQLASYEQDPVVVTAMRQACHRNLYNLANSSGMNGIGKDTYVKDTGLLLVKIMQIVLAGLLLVLVICMACWNRAWRRLRKTQAYLNYRTMLQTIKAEKKRK